ncbi:MAG: DUF4384 domain-containing protein [Thermodesulfobacterium sp.]|nr:DUF4384 domain-containing protein [Thermodesulfobacterium sp.]
MCKEIAHEISIKKELSGKRVAILNFKDLAGGSSYFDVYIVSKLTSCFFNTSFDVYIVSKLTSCFFNTRNKEFSLVNRMDIARLIDELEVYGEQESFDLDKWVKNLRADFVLTGDYRWFALDKKLLLTIRLIRPEDGALIFSRTKEIKVDSDLERILSTPYSRNRLIEAIENVSSFNTKTVNQKWISLYVLSEGKRIPIDKEAPVIKVGDKIGFSITPPMDSKIYVFNYTPLQKEVIFLYPISVLKPMVFEKNKTYFFPECIDPDAITYTVEPPIGRACIKVIGISKDIDIDLTSSLMAKDGYFILTQKELRSFLKILNTIPPASWWEDSINFWVVDHK